MEYLFIRQFLCRVKNQNKIFYQETAYESKKMGTCGAGFFGFLNISFPPFCEKWRDPKFLLLFRKCFVPVPNLVDMYHTPLIDNIFSATPTPSNMMKIIYRPLNIRNPSPFGIYMAPFHMPQRNKIFQSIFYCYSKRMFSIALLLSKF